jgi:adenylylsulfate kinase
MKEQQGFALWITGIPSSGKSSITRELAAKLKTRGVATAVLESDQMRRILTPEPTYAVEERDRFYETIARIGHLMTQQGISIIFDATAHKRLYRDRARKLISRFLEAYLLCPLELCMQRDSKGIYRSAEEGASASVPGLQVPYEPPLHPEITLDCRQAPAENAGALESFLRSRKYI